MTANRSAAADVLPVAQPASSSELLFKTDREKFFAILTHDDRGSRYIVSTDASGAWQDTALDAVSLSACRFDARANYYVTRNGFSGRRRLDARVRQLNSIFLDVDFHDGATEDRDTLISEVLRKVESAVAESALPKPTMVVNSGRGLHFYYVLQRSVPYRVRGGGGVNEKGISYFSHVQSQLADVLDEVLLDVEGAKVDRAVFDFARVSRIPDTYNTKAGRYARLVSAEEAYYHLPELDAYKPSTAAGGAAPASKPRKTAFRVRFDKLLLARLNKVAELQECRGFDCEGSRELMAFVYYNTAVQVYEREEAWSRVLWFNSRFRNPLPEGELKGIKSAVSSVVNVRGERGYYVLSASTIVKMLGITEKEAEEVRFFGSKRTFDRLEAKRKTAEKKQARNERIIALREEGKTRRDIAKELGVSLGTVHNVLKEAGLTRANKKEPAAHRRPAQHVERASLRRSVDIVSAEGVSHEGLRAESFAASPKSTKIWHTGYGVVIRRMQYGEELRLVSPVLSGRLGVNPPDFLFNPLGFNPLSADGGDLGSEPLDVDALEWRYAP